MVAVLETVFQVILVDRVVGVKEIVQMMTTLKVELELEDKDILEDLAITDTIIHIKELVVEEEVLMAQVDQFPLEAPSMVLLMAAGVDREFIIL
jgi:hypothetical protein